jgi:hypothetical protein
MKIEKWNLLKLFEEGGKGRKENEGAGNSNRYNVNITMCALVQLL